MTLSAAHGGLIMQSSNYLAVTSSSNASIIVGSNMTLSAAQGLNLESSSYLAATSSSNASIIAGSNMTLSAAHDIHMRSSNELTTMSSSNTVISAGSNMSLRSSNNLSIHTGSNLTLVSGSNTHVSSCNDVTINAQRQMVLKSSASMALHASNDIAIITPTRLDVTTNGQVTLVSNSNNVLIYAAASNIECVARSNITIAACNDVNVSSSCNIVITGPRQWVYADYYNVSCQSNYGVYATSNTYVTGGSNAFVHGNTLMRMTSSNMVIVDSRQDVLINAAGVLSLSNVVLSNMSASNASITSRQTVFIGGSNVSTRASNMTIDSIVSQFNVQTTMNVSASNANMGACNIVTIEGNNGGVVLSAGQTLQGGASRAQVVVGSQSSKNITLTADNIISSGLSNVTMEVNGVQVLRATSSNNKPVVRVNGDLQVVGVVDNVSVTNTYLTVQDKSITLAHPSSSDAAPLTDAIIGRAGLHIKAIVETDKRLEKSFTWNHSGGGVTQLMTSNGLQSGESYWDVRGGSLRLTGVRNDGREVSYGFRIAPNGVLELYQVVLQSDGITSHTRVIQRFGTA